MELEIKSEGMRQAIEQRIDQLRKYLESCGGWKLYEFEKSRKIPNVYKFLCYKIRRLETTFMAGLVKFRNGEPNIFLFMHLEDTNFFEL